MPPTALVRLKGPYVGMARHLRDRDGWTIHGYSPSPVSEKHRAVAGEFLDLYRVIEDAKAGALPADVLQRGLALEERYGLNLAELLAPDRHFGAGWLTGGLYHRGALSYLPYERQVHILDRTFDAVEAFLDRTRPDLALPGLVGSFVGGILYAACDRRRIPTFGLNPLNYGRLWYWQRDRYGHIPGLEEAYAKLRGTVDAPPQEPVNDIAPYTRSAIPAIQAKGRRLHLLKSAAVVAARHAKAATIGPRKPGEIYLREELRYLWQNHANYRREMRRRWDDLAEVARRPFVYFPLHYEPEASLNGVEAYFTNQLYAIELLSKSVPADVAVVLKEHPAAVGNRPRGWMDTVAGFPRVKVLAPFVNSVEVCKRAMATATITGTAGLEAAILGKPVVSLGPCYRFNFVDHVWFANDLPALRAVFRRLRTAPVQDHRADGAALAQALEQTCFRMDENLGLTNEPAAASVAQACQALQELLAARPAPPSKLVQDRPRLPAPLPR